MLLSSSMVKSEQGRLAPWEVSSRVLRAVDMEEKS